MKKSQILNRVRLLVPAIAVLIALNQLYRANFDTLTPWKGGGFGMFSSIRGSSERRIIARPIGLADTLSDIHIDLARATLKKIGWHEERHRSFRSYPKPDQLEDIGRGLLQLSYVLSDNEELNVAAERIGKENNHMIWEAQIKPKTMNTENKYEFSELVLVLEQVAWNKETEELYYEELFRTKVNK